MAITNEEWASITAAISREIDSRIGRRRDYFTMGKVIRRDEKNNLIWVNNEDMKDIKIPIFTFDYKISYFDESPRGAPINGYRVYRKETSVRPKVPEKGETVLIAREMGNVLLPRCLGVLRSKNYIEDLDDT